MKFNYTVSTTRPTKAFPNGRDVYNPFVDIKIRNKKKESYAFSVLVDSGADNYVFGKTTAENLDLKIKSGKKVELGRHGEECENMYLHDVELIFEGFRYKTTVGFINRDDFSPV